MKIPKEDVEFFKKEYPIDIIFEDFFCLGDEVGTIIVEDLYNENYSNVFTVELECVEIDLNRVISKFKRKTLFDFEKDENNEA